MMNEDSSTSIVQAAGLAKTFHPKNMPDVVALDSIDITVREGRLTALVGPNGAGKTTTFRMLCGLLPLTSGKLSVAGVDLRTARTEARHVRVAVRDACAHL